MPDLTPENDARLVPVEAIERRICWLRGEKVILGSDLAELYGVATKVLNQAVRRNSKRFPEDFMFQLSNEEFEHLRSQSVTSSWGGRRYPPYAFTEHGALMAANILRSERAVEVSVQVVRAFVRLRAWLASNAELARKLEELEARYDDQFSQVFAAIRSLMTPPEEEPRPIGFRSHDDD